MENMYVEFPVGSIRHIDNKWQLLPDVLKLLPETRSLENFDPEKLDILASKILFLGESPTGRVFTQVAFQKQEIFLTSFDEPKYKLGVYLPEANSVRISEDVHLTLLKKDWVETLIKIMNQRADAIIHSESKRVRLIEKDMVLLPQPWLFGKPECDREVWIELRVRGIDIDEDLTPRFLWYFATESSFPLLATPKDLDIVYSKPGFSGWFIGEGFFRAGLVKTVRENTYDVIPLNKDGEAIGFRYGTASEFGGELTFFDNYGRRISMRVLKNRYEAEQRCLENEVAFTSSITLGEVREALESETSLQNIETFVEEKYEDVEEKGNESLWKIIDSMKK